MSTIKRCFVGLALLLLILGLDGGYLPIPKASKIDPFDFLRYEIEVEGVTKRGWSQYVMIWLAAAAGVPAALLADATIQYKMETKIAPDLPEGTRTGIASMAARRRPMSLRVKGHMGYMLAGDLAWLIDLETQKVTFVDHGHRALVSTMPCGKSIADTRRPEVLVKLPSGFHIMEESHATGRTDDIQGVPAEEREIDISIFGITGTPASPEVELVVRIWIARGGEVSETKPVRELATVGRCVAQIPPVVAAGLTDLAQGIVTSLRAEEAETEAGLAEMSAIGFTVLEAFSELGSNPMIVLRLEMAAYLRGRDLPAVEVACMGEISDAPVEAALFELPKGYRGPGDMTDDVGRASRMSVGPPPQRGNRIRVGKDVQAAHIIRQVTPLYPRVAMEKHIAGHVILQAVIANDGTVRELTVRSGDSALVPAAIEAVKQWVYKPTLLNGDPVEVVTLIDVDFELPPNSVLH